MVGTDIMHAFEYTSIINCADNDAFPMMAMRPMDPRMEARLAMVRNDAPAAPAPAITGEDLRRDPDFGPTRVVAWWSDDEEALQAAVAKLGVPHAAKSLAELLDAVDVVWICTKSAASHYALARAGLKAGRHVLVDKPFTATYREAAELLDLAEQRGRVLASSSPWRWAPVVQYLKARIEALGGVRSVLCSAPAIDGAFYLTHSADVVDELVGSNLEHVTRLHGPVHDSIVADYPGGTRAIINGMREIGWVRHIAIFGERGYLEGEITNAQRDLGKVELVRRFVVAAAQGRNPLGRPQMEHVMRLITSPADEGGRGASPMHGGAP